MPTQPTKAHKYAKLREMMLHIATKERDNPTFGATKLNKILYYADALWYLRTGKSLTGAEYTKLDHGPAPRTLLPAQVSLVRDEAATIDIRRLPFRAQKRLVPKREAQLDGLYRVEEVEFVDQIIDALRDMSAGQTRDMTHKLLGWRLADYGEEIPYYTALFDIDGDVAKPSDIRRGIELAKERGWSSNASPA
ncbi:MAG TPA: Panacea domain-containing protein [Candidatus Sulfotelmatobacter sp.]|nr:Panacea domain-containing protein [Candidatus Sulfotelmatobacter sp.]